MSKIIGPIMNTSRVSDNINFEKELIITKMHIPFFRAGNGWFFILLIGVWMYLGVNIIEYFQIKVFGSIILFLGTIYFLRRFISYVSRIKFYGDRIKIINSISEKVIYLRDIEKIKLSIIPLSYAITLKFKIKDKLLPLSFSFVVMKTTNFGDYKQTLSEIEEMITCYDIPYKKSLDLLKPAKRKS